MGLVWEKWFNSMLFFFLRADAGPVVEDVDGAGRHGAQVQSWTSKVGLRKKFYANSMHSTWFFFVDIEQRFCAKYAIGLVWGS